MPAGRPRTPNRLKALHGETRPSRLRVEPQPAERGPEPPHWLSEPARAVWDRVTRELEAMGLLFASDTEAIAAYASSAALLGEAEQALTAEGCMRTDDHGETRRNPWLMIRAGALDGIHKFGSALGLSPAARAHLPVSPTREMTEAERLADRLLSH